MVTPIFSDGLFSGNLAVVSGAASGIGLATANYLEHLGAQVVRIDCAYKENSELCYAVDICDYTAVDNCLTDITRRLGNIDFYVHAAGILEPSPLLNMDIQSWQKTFAVNCFGAIYCCSKVAQMMTKLSRGAMVVIGSNAASTPRTLLGSYASSKAAVHQFIRCLALEVAEHNVRINIVAPGSTDTPMQRMLWQSSADEDAVIAGNLRQFRTGIPLQKIAKPSDIAKSVAFLLSDAANHITLETLTIDGGATLGI